MANKGNEQVESQPPSTEDVHARYAAAKRRRARVNSLFLALLGAIILLGGVATAVVCLVGRRVGSAALYGLLAIILGGTFLARGLLGCKNPDRYGGNVLRSIDDTFFR